jgi:hypothetical protein
MPSFVWSRDPSEAFLEPYEYGGQEQFAREAVAVIAYLMKHYDTPESRFPVSDTSRRRAVWMLQVDALSALSDAVELLEEKRFRIVSRLFRDVVETLDASYYFALAGEAASKNLHKWYQNEVISHRIFRDFVQRHHGPAEAENLRNLYSDLSKYTHRTFHALSMSYLLGCGETAVYDGFRPKASFYVLPHVVSFAYAMLAGLIKRFVRFAVDTGQMTAAAEVALWEACLETETVPRRFGFGPGQLMRGPSIPLDEA